MTNTANMQSPCIQECQYEAALDQCLSCGRTLEQIAQWRHYTDGERAAIMQELSARRSSDAE